MHSIHVPFETVPDALKSTLRDIFSTFDYVYTTNYDLLLYWSLMDERKKFKDFFWFQKNAEGEPQRVVFNLWDTAVWNEVTKVIYLHGALHLYRNADGETYKAVGMSGDLLERFAQEAASLPLFISEGTSKDKLWSIRRNEYLSFAFERFATHRGSMVVFGQSLAPEFDQHIIDAINNWCRYNQRRTAGKDFKRDIAISVYPRGLSSDDIAALKLRMRKLLSPHYTLHYFDSTSHPLGAPSLRINPG